MQKYDSISIGQYILALSDVFFAAYYIDLKKQTYRTLKATDYAKKMLEGCYDITTGFQSFIKTLVKPEYVEKITEFCKTETISERLRGYKHIDCEYESKVAAGWCQISFIPVNYDEKGEVSHVLFVVTMIDADKVQDIKEGIRSKKSLQELFDHVPGGIVMYQWDGQQLKTLRNSKYYEKQYGASMVSHGKNNGGPDFKRVHPDDIEDYKKAIIKALNETHYLEYVYRVWNESQKQYVWTKINAVSEQQPDGISYIYAMYSDVTELINQEIELKKEQRENDLRRYQLEHDILTGIYNRHGYENMLEHYQKDTRPSIYIQIDIDNFKALNDTYGHEFGDETLKEVAKELAASFKTGDYVFRFGGDEFAVLMWSEKKILWKTISDLQQRMHAHINQKLKKEIYITLSMGICWSETGFDEDMISLADEALYITKKNGRAGCSVIDRHHQVIYQWKDNRADQKIINPLMQSNIGSYRVEFKCEDFRHGLLNCDETARILMGLSEKMTPEECYETWLSRVDRAYMEIVVQTKNEMVEKGQAECTYAYHHPLYGRIMVRSGGKSEKTKEGIILFGYHQSLQETHIILKEEDHQKLLDAHVSVQMLKKTMEHDYLTGLYNRKRLMKECKHLLRKHPDEKFAMLHIDLNHFHRYNTFFGDGAGDKLLCDVADILRSIDGDYEYWVYGRVEADVFCALVPVKAKMYEKHIQYITQLLKKYRDDYLVEPKFGIFFIYDSEMSIESMFARATMAAKTIKPNVENQVAVYNDFMEWKLREEQQIVNEMDNAMQQEQFMVYLQPKYSLCTNKTIGAEALVRWKHPEKGIVSPAKFIPLFEKNGFILNLDRYMWEHVCKLLRKWMDEGKTPAPVSVNVSRISIFSPTTVSFLKALMEKYRIDPKYLELELTESAYIQNPDEIKPRLVELQNYGFKILMDDFGSGYSSLNALKDLPVDILKLDMKFLSATDDSGRGNMILSSVMRMSLLLDLPVIAEGVETVEQANYLRSIGCEYVQGYLFARPMPVRDYEEMLLNHLDAVSFMKHKDSQQLGRTMTDVAASPKMFEEIFKTPMAVIEYHNGSFMFLRINPVFQSEFEMTEDLQPATKAFRTHLPEEDYLRLLRAYEKCAETRRSVCFYIKWISSQNEEQNYMVRVDYEGETATEKIMVVAFTNVATIEYVY